MISIHPNGAERACGVFVVLAATTIAAISARNFAGGWNDGSRLATIECLVDHHTLRIDRSIFVRSPESVDSLPNPYAPGDENLRINGTQDKLLIGGHYYSDKPPVAAVALAGLYKALQSSAGLVARQNPERFCYLMTLASSGLAYVAAVSCVFRFAGLLGLDLRCCLGLTVSFGLATVALPYGRHLNAHEILLGVCAALMLAFTRLAHEAESGTWRLRRPIEIGLLAGLGYTIDLGVGPVLLLGSLGLVLVRTRRLSAAAVFVLAAAPWLVAHHVLNWYIGGTWTPASSHIAYLSWPGSPFTEQNITGGWHHQSAGRFVLYALDLLFGKQGFLSHNLPLFLTLPGFFLLWHRCPRQRPELVFAGWLAALTWLLYAALSTNHSGACCSVRWFVPLLAPGYYVLVLLLRECPTSRREFLPLSAVGAVLGVDMWWHGPWYGKVLPGFWALYVGGLVAWGAVTFLRARNRDA